MGLSLLSRLFNEITVGKSFSNFSASYSGHWPQKDRAQSQYYSSLHTIIGCMTLGHTKHDLAT